MVREEERLEEILRRGEEYKRKEEEEDFKF